MASIYVFEGFGSSLVSLLMRIMGFECRLRVGLMRVAWGLGPLELARIDKIEFKIVNKL